MRRSLKSLPLALSFMLALAAVGFFLTSCSNNQSQARFVDAVWDAGTMDIFFGGTRYFSGLALQGVEPTSGYSGVPAGSSTIIGYPSGTSTTPSFTTPNVNLNASSQYTLIAAGNIASGPNNVIVMNPVDNNNGPADGNVNFRIIYASPDGPSTVYVYIIPNPLVGSTCQGTPTATLSYQGVSTYITMPYNSNGQGYTVWLCNAQGGNPLTGDTSGYSFNAGSLALGAIRTLIFTDNSTGTYVSVPQPVLLKDLN